MKGGVVSWGRPVLIRRSPTGGNSVESSVYIPPVTPQDVVEFVREFSLQSSAVWILCGLTVGCSRLEGFGLKLKSELKAQIRGQDKLLQLCCNSVATLLQLCCMLSSSERKSTQAHVLPQALTQGLNRSLRLTSQRQA